MYSYEFNIDLVFYHELGHFVAHRLNQIRLGGLGVKEMKFYPRGEGDRYGHNALVKPVDYIKGTPVPVSRLPQYLASLCYGCYFQSYYTNKVSFDRLDLREIDLFDNCFNKGGNGFSDLEKWASGIQDCGLGAYNREFFETSKTHFNKIIVNKSLESFMTLHPDDYLKEDEIGNLTANLEILLTASQNMIEEHSMEYFFLVKQFQDLTNMYV